MEMKERLTKAQEVLEKLKKTLERHTTRHNKLVEMKQGGKLSKKYRESADPQFWLNADIKWCEEDIKHTQKKIDKQNEKISEMVAKIETTEKELNELPEILRKLQRELENRWNSEEPANEKRNKLAAKMYVLDLVRRVKAKVGTITDYSGIRLDSNGYSLNGVVKGTQGDATLETIIAGGYNVQRLHLRTLVK